MEPSPERNPTRIDVPGWGFTGIGGGERELAPPPPPHITGEEEVDALPVVESRVDESSTETAVLGVVADADVGEGNNNHQDVAGPQAQDQASGAGNASPCKICFTNLDPEQVIYLNCGCIYCVECLNAHFRSGLANRASYPPTCCSQQAIDIAVVQGYLDDDNIIRYHMVQEEFSARLPLYCANKDCGTTFIGDAASIDLQGYQTMVFCPECALETCARCRELRAAHVDNEGVFECPDSLALANVKEMAEEENWRRCPGCRHLVEKIDGCDHMICDCRTEFHYICGERYSNEGRCGCTLNTGLDDNEDQVGQDDGLEEEVAEPAEGNFEQQLPEHIQGDLHLPYDFPFNLPDELGQTPAEVIQFIIDDMLVLLDSRREEARDEVIADEDQVMQEPAGADTVETAGIGSEATEVVEVAGAHHRVEGAAGNTDDGPETQVRGQQSANQAEEGGEGDEDGNLHAMTETARVALADFRKASAELQTAATALVRIRRRRAERVVAAAAEGAPPFVPHGNRGRGRGRGRGLAGRAWGRGGRRRAEGLGGQVPGG